MKFYIDVSSVTAQLVIYHMTTFPFGIRVLYSTGRMAHRKWKEAKQLPGTAGPGNMLGCSLISFHFLWAILCPQAVQCGYTCNEIMG